ncbi:UNVERIFIED_CONTAM: hypothetical protein HDU68_006623 [Siphonaria sp. JEL0065]|nr:hypothetical protein HDU68_006623 [Siphonaria sp. JEL0065]
MEVEEPSTRTGGGVSLLPPSMPHPIPIPGPRRTYNHPTSPMNIKSMISSSAPVLGPGGIDILNNDNSPDDDVFMTEYILPDPQPPIRHPARAFSEESIRIQARDYHNAMLVGSLPIRDPRTGVFVRDFRNPTLMRSLEPIASQYHNEFIVGNQQLLRPIDVASPPYDYQQQQQPSSPEGNWSVLSSSSSSVVKMNDRGDRIYLAPHQITEFLRSSDLRSHTHTAHPNLPSHVCEYCQSRFTRKNDLLRHEKTVHSSEL